MRGLSLRRCICTTPNSSIWASLTIGWGNSSLHSVCPNAFFVVFETRGVVVLERRMPILYDIALTVLDCWIAIFYLLGKPPVKNSSNDDRWQSDYIINICKVSHLSQALRNWMREQSWKFLITQWSNRVIFLLVSRVIYKTDIGYNCWKSVDEPIRAIAWKVAKAQWMEAITSTFH
jgi:hypothetical protein